MENGRVATQKERMIRGTKGFMYFRSPTETENPQGKDASHLLGMTIAVISNPFEVLGVRSVKDLPYSSVQIRTRRNRS